VILSPCILRPSKANISSLFLLAKIILPKFIGSLFNSLTKAELDASLEFKALTNLDAKDWCCTAYTTEFSTLLNDEVNNSVWALVSKLINLVNVFLAGENLFSTYIYLP